MRPFQTMAMWEKWVDKQNPGVLWQRPGDCPSRAVAFPHLSIFPYLQLHTSFSTFSVSSWFCISVTLRMVTMLGGNKGMRGKRKLLHCCWMWRHSWCEGLEALCSQILGFVITLVCLICYRDNGWFRAISQLFTIFTLMEEKQVGEWWNCSLRRKTTKVVKTCTKSHA